MDFLFNLKIEKLLFCRSDFVKKEVIEIVEFKSMDLNTGQERVEMRKNVLKKLLEGRK